MSQPVSLKAAERKVFTTMYNDGMLDIFIGSVFLIFAIAPLLSARLGDFWSSVVFLPFWAVIYLFIRFLKKNVITPRLGQVKFGQARQIRLKKLSLVMLVINLLALLLGIVAAVSFRDSGYLYAVILAVILLVGFSLAAHFLDMNRLYLYGLLTLLLPLAGEWLFQQGLASHHGYPLAFGFLSGFIILFGVVIFLRLLKMNPLPLNDGTSGES